MARGELQKSDEMAAQHLQMAQQLDSPVVLLAAHVGRGITSYLRGDFLSARTHLDQTFALYDTRQHQALASLYGDDLSAASSGAHALVLWALGYPERALTQLQEKLLPADELPSLLSLGTAHMFATLFHQYRRERAMMLERAEALLALSQENGLPFYLTVGTICRGWASMEQGDGEAGIAQIREGLAMSEAAGTRNLGPYFRALLAEAYQQTGHPEEGLPFLAEAVAEIDESDGRQYEAEIYRLQGELTLQKFKVQGSEFNGQDEAEESFRKAIDVAQKQSAKSWELRAATSLARLWQQQGKTAEARQLLSEIYNWFTEGFDTKDLTEAKALLEELG